MSPWWRLLNDHNVSDPGSHAGRKFRGKFQVQRNIFDDLLSETRACGLFTDKQAGESAFGPMPHPLELKMLAALR
eukprot:5231090-Pleurochrysis_carterae.AAC.1